RRGAAGRHQRGERHAGLLLAEAADLLGRRGHGIVRSTEYRVRSATCGLGIYPSEGERTTRRPGALPCSAACSLQIGSGMSLFRRRPAPAPDYSQRLPPGQVLTAKWPVLHYGAVPYLKTEKWELRLFGEVEEEVTLSWEELE